MSRTIRCSNCEQTLSVREEHRGLQVQCPQCQTVLTITFPDDPPQEPEDIPMLTPYESSEEPDVPIELVPEKSVEESSGKPDVPTLIPDEPPPPRRRQPEPEPPPRPSRRERDDDEVKPGGSMLKACLVLVFSMVIICGGVIAMIVPAINKLQEDLKEPDTGTTIPTEAEGIE